MKKKIGKKRLGIFILCLMLGLGIVVQSRATDGLRLYVSPKTIDDYVTTTETEEKEVQRVRDLIGEAEVKLKLYESIETEDRKSYEAITMAMEKEIAEYQVFSGLTKVQGPGLTITIDDGTRPLFAGENINNVLVHDSDVIRIVNDLKGCGAEAIAVNGQRIIHITSISCSGYTIRINGITYARPFVIQAIGNAERMRSVLNSPVGYGTILKDMGILFKTEKSEDLILPAYGGDVRYKYMKVKEGEGN